MIVSRSRRSSSVGKIDLSRAQCQISKSSKSSGLVTGFGLADILSSNKTLNLVLIYCDYLSINNRSISEELQYLNDLSSIISVNMLAVRMTKEYLEISLILVDRFPLSLLPPLRQISLVDLVKERYHHPFVIVLRLECCPLFPPLELIVAPISYQLN